VSEPADQEAPAGPWAVSLVILDVATLGFITLGFEMVASRILTPLFGSGIYTWATIISIVVAGLMAGYFVGGLLADRFPTFTLAAAIKLVAAVYLAVVFALAGDGLESIIDRIPGETTALFAGGLIVCFPPLVVLGMYSPLSVRLLLRRPGDAGKISGGLFAISCLGNIAGILGTTFLLIPTIGTRAITGGFAGFLFVSGLVSIAARLSQRTTEP
jgi:predicted membrane-bound spermidine synthase